MRANPPMVLVDGEESNNNRNGRAPARASPCYMCACLTVHYIDLASFIIRLQLGKNTPALATALCAQEDDKMRRSRHVHVACMYARTISGHARHYLFMG
jgi:hypothetical protein